MIIAKKSKSNGDGKTKVICRKCFHQIACEFELNADGRCLFYINDDLIGTDQGTRIDSMDAYTIDYEVIERMVKSQNSF